MKPNLSSQQYKTLRRAELFAEQDGRCFWCDEPMKLLERYPTSGSLHPRVCTLDHLRDRDNPKRLERPLSGERRYVAACYDCNHGRDLSRKRTNSAIEHRAAVRNTQEAA